MRELQRAQRNSLDYSVEQRLMCMCGETTRGWEKKQPKIQRETLFGAHTGIGMVPVPIIQTRKTPSSQGTGQSPQKGLRYSSVILTAFNPFKSLKKKRLVGRTRAMFILRLIIPHY